MILENEGMSRVKLYIGTLCWKRTSVIILQISGLGSSRSSNLEKNSSKNPSSVTVFHIYLHFPDRRLVQTSSWMFKYVRMLSMTLHGKSLIRSM
ncbi:F-box/FBD/LRR-repeat protein [Trifolium repens]|nr:F-box/FBD/LRR-repeat protein [Trifolium repens]